MNGFTTNQWILVGLFWLLGLLIGLLLAPRRGPLRDRLADERARREAAEQRAAAAEARITASNERIAELERERAAYPIGAGTAASIGAAASGRRDDLALIHGIGRDGEVRLNECGIHRYSEIAGLSDTEAAALEGRLGLTPGRIEREQWRQQAELLRHGKLEEHRTRYAV